MPNSNRTTSNTQTTTNSTPATFKAGDSVLCPSFSPTLTPDSFSKHAKRKSYYKKYRAMRKPNQSQARGTR